MSSQVTYVIIFCGCGSFGLLLYLLAKKQWFEVCCLAIFLCVVGSYLRISFGFPITVELKDATQAGYARIIACYFFMILGIVAEHFYRVLHKERPSEGIWRSFIASLLISPMIFCAFLETMERNSQTNAGSPQEQIMILFLAFQNGWFWRSVFRSCGPGHSTRTPTRKRSTKATTMQVVTLAFLLCSLTASKSSASDSYPEPEGIENHYVRQEPGSSFGEKVSSYLKKFYDWDYTKPGRSYALVVGVGNYTHLPKLEWAVIDAQKVSRALESLGFDEVVTLTDDKVTWRRVSRYMSQYFPSRIKQGDRFLFYWSGHGTTKQLRADLYQGFLPLVDERPKEYDTSISMDILKLWSGQLSIAGARHSLFLLDSCFSGLAGVELKGSPVDRFYIEALDQESGRHLITSGTASQKSQAGRKWQGSLFTTLFMEAVTKGRADVNGDGVIPVDELYAYLRKAVRTEARQTPQIRDLGDKRRDNGQFFFVTKDPPLPESRIPRRAELGLMEMKGTYDPADEVERIMTGKMRKDDLRYELDIAKRKRDNVGALRFIAGAVTCWGILQTVFPDDIFVGPATFPEEDDSTKRHQFWGGVYVASGVIGYLLTNREYNVLDEDVRRIEQTLEQDFGLMFQPSSDGVVVSLSFRF